MDGVSRVGRGSVALALLLGVSPAGGQELRFDVQGHRGCRGLAPENTLAAFERALELEVTTLELDAQLTRDGVFVVYHDARLNPKICFHDDGRKPRRRPIHQIDSAELADLDCGSRTLKKFPQQVPAPGARIPRLEDVLDLAAGAAYDVGVSIELKQSVDELPLPLDEALERLLELLERRGLAERAIIQSRWSGVLAAVREKAPAIDRALLVRLGKAKGRVADGTATIVSRKAMWLRRSGVVKLQALGARVIPYTVNRRAAIEKMLDWGVDGVITDYPDRALGAVRERRPRVKRGSSAGPQGQRPGHRRPEAAALP